MKYHLIGIMVASATCVPWTSAVASADTLGLEPTVNTVCLDTRLTHEGAKACHEQMADADTLAEQQDVMRRFVARIEGQTPLRNSLTSSGAGVKNATPAPGVGDAASRNAARDESVNISVVTYVRRSSVPTDTSFTGRDFQKFRALNNGEWTTVQGKVLSSTGNSFELESSGKTLLVEMDDFDLHNENPVQAGDYATVIGKRYEAADGRAKVEADRLFVDRLATEAYASAANEEGYNRPLVPYTGGEGIVSRNGKVTEHGGNEAHLATSLGELRVNLQAVENHAVINSGDELRVYGSQSGNTFEATHAAILRRN